MKRLALRISILFFLFAVPANKPALSGEKIWTISGLKVQANALTISPSSPNVAYASNYEAGAIFKTTDGGSSWTQVLRDARPGAMGVHPSNPDVVIASAYFAGTESWAVLKTSDGGKTWTPIDYAPFFTRGYYLSIQFHPACPNIVDVVEADHLYRSLDGGTSWTDRLSVTVEVFDGWYDSGSFQQLVVDPKNPDNLYAIAWDWIFKSDDGGYSWDGLLFTDHRTYVSSLAINPQNPEVLWAVATEGIYTTVNGGSAWKLINRDASDIDFIAVAPILPDNMYATVNHGVKQSTNGGITWSDMSTGLTPTDNISSLVINPQNPQILYVASASGVYSYSLGTHVTTLHFPRLVTREGSTVDPENSEYTGIGIVNVDTENAGLTFTAYSPDGTLISGERISNPAMRFLRPGEQMVIMDRELWGDGWAAAQPAAWFTVDSTAKITGSFLTFNQNLSTMNGADASSESHRSVVFTEITDKGFTRMYLANPNADAASVHVELVDQNGQVKGTALRKIGPSGVVMELVSSLFPGVESQPSDYVRASSDQAVVPFEATDKPGQFAHALNGQDSLAGATMLYCPQYVASSSNWNTSVSIVNPSGVEATALLRLIGDDGKQIGPERRVTIAGGGKAYIADQAFFLSNTVTEVRGFLLIESVGPSAQPLIGSTSFGKSGEENVVLSLPLVQTLATDYVFSPVASDSTWWSGIAIVNPNDSAATITLELLDGSGTIMSTATLTIPAGQRISRLLTEYFGDIVGKDIHSGYVHAVSDRGVAVFAALGTHSLSAISTIPGQSVR